MADPVPALRTADYFLPGSAAEALELLGARGAGARLLAGGQTLIPEIDRPGGGIDAVIDLRLIPELRRIDRTDRHIELGAMVTIDEARRALSRDFPVVAACFGSVGNSAVRNRATLGGSIALADPASEISTFLLAYDAAIMLAGSAEEMVPLSGAIGEALDPARFVVGVRIALPPAGERAGFNEILRRRSGGRSLAMALARIAPSGASLTVSGGAHQPVRFERPDGGALLAALDRRRDDFGGGATTAWVMAAARRAIAEAGVAA